MPQDSDPKSPDADALAKALELELMSKRASWQSARAKRGTWRALSVLFLLLVIVGGLCAWYFLASEMRERRRETPAAQDGR